MSSTQGLTVNDVLQRIDDCVQKHATLERILWSALIAMFAIGIGVLLYGISHEDKYLIGISVGETGFIGWPVLKLMQLHRRRMALTVIPAITALLSPRDAARELHALIAELLK